jgi:RNA polymerase sigma-70 factor (ECF subfamily)
MTAAEQVERIFREEHGRVLAALISQFEDFDIAEDSLQDALVNALERWEIDSVPRSAEAPGLLAPMLLHDSRREARLTPTGELILLEEQDRTRWDQAKIHEGITVLDEALALYDPGPYQVQAAISALHAEAATPEATDWRQITALYDRLATMTSSVAVEVNRAVAVAMARGVLEGLLMLLQLESQAKGFFSYHAARADLLRRTNQREAAVDAYRRALDLCGNRVERAYLQRRLDGIEHRVH